MSELKKYTVTWTQDHKKIIHATSENGALIDAKLSNGERIKKYNYNIIGVE